MDFFLRIFSILSLLVVIRSEKQKCGTPSTCACDSQLGIIDCEGLGLRTVPYFSPRITRKYKTLNVRGNYLLAIPSLPSSIRILAEGNPLELCDQIRDLDNVEMTECQG
jgi:hypothetical protein